MQRYFIYLSFDGTQYHGWQIQPNGMTVQQKLQEALKTILRHETDITGAGRTDAGVHARLMVAHFDHEAIDEQQLCYKLNKLLPQDIAIQKIVAVNHDMHARFSAKWRTYHYYVHTCKDPFARHFSFEMYGQLDFQLMNQAAQILLGCDDFAAFCKSHTDVKTTLCKVTEAEWRQTDEHHYCFVITANRFLRNMVRAVVGTLIEVGRHRMTIKEFEQVVASGQRTMAGESMPAKALFLHDIKY